MAFDGFASESGDFVHRPGVCGSRDAGAAIRLVDEGASDPPIWHRDEAIALGTQVLDARQPARRAEPAPTDARADVVGQRGARLARADATFLRFAAQGIAPLALGVELEAPAPAPDPRCAARPAPQNLATSAVKAPRR
jgi:hypothetical protein